MRMTTLSEWRALYCQPLGVEEIGEITMSMTPDPPVLLRVRANHLDKPGSLREGIISIPAILSGARGRVARGGHLLVTTSEVIFEPHAFNLNIEKSQLRIPVSEIVGTRLRTVILTATIVLSTAHCGDVEFVSWSRKKIVAAILQARAAQGLPCW
jgi:hypothetical protein